jgi:hypothetical protein
VPGTRPRPRDPAQTRRRWNQPADPETRRRSSSWWGLSSIPQGPRTGARVKLRESKGSSSNRRRRRPFPGRERDTAVGLVGEKTVVAAGGAAWRLDTPARPDSELGAGSGTRDPTNGKAVGDRPSEGRDVTQEGDGSISEAVRNEVRLHPSRDGNTCGPHVPGPSRPQP